MNEQWPDERKSKRTNETVQTNEIMNGQAKEWTSHWMNTVKRMNEWVNTLTIHWINKGTNKRMKEHTNELMKRWAKDWMDKWRNEWKSEPVCVYVCKILWFAVINSYFFFIFCRFTSLRCGGLTAALRSSSGVTANSLICRYVYFSFQSTRLGNRVLHFLVWF